VLRIFARQLIIFELVLCTWAATPADRVSSSQPSEMNGATVPAAGVHSRPLFAGDVIVTRSAPATVIFRGGSRIVREPNSELKIEVKDRKPIVRLLHGSGKYFLAGVIVALSTKAAVSLDGADSKGYPDALVSQKPPAIFPTVRP
jgi:hypothetical protein